MEPVRLRFSMMNTKKVPFMNKQSLMLYLNGNLKNEPGWNAIEQEINERYTNTPDLGVEDLLYWLDESLYSTLGWKKKHEQEDLPEKEAEEEKKAVLLQKAIDLLDAIQEAERK